MTTGQPLLDRLLERHSPYELIVSLFSVLTALFVLPFIAIRLASAEWLHALLDAAVVALALACGLGAWYGRRADVAGPVVAAVFLGTMITVVHLFGPALLVWAFPVTAAIFFLLEPGRAALANAAALVAILPRVAELGAVPEIAGYLAALLATNALALAFAVPMVGSRRRFRALAERDALTGAGNRRALDPALREALDRHAERGTPCALVVVDIDHFKSVNDRHGHDAGDRVLVALTELVRRNVRAGDDIFRYGGEELVILAHGANAGPAGQLAEVIRARVAAADLLGEEPLTVSAGVAESRPEDTIESWFRRADERLYDAKRAGRDRVRVEAGAA